MISKEQVKTYEEENIFWVEASESVEIDASKAWWSSGICS